MRAPRIYLPVPLSEGAIVPLTGKAFQHAIQVLRLKPGFPVILFNGQGGEFQATLLAVERRCARVVIDAFLPLGLESPLEVQLAQAVAKGERMDYTLQKAVELGVSRIVPLWTERSVVHLSEARLESRLLHWRAVVAGACEQCGRNILPPVLEPQRLDSWLERQGDLSAKLLLDPAASRRLTQLPHPGQTVVMLIGPEGGLSPIEIGSAQKAGFIGIRLGPRVMRTETAGVAALAALQTLWGDLG